VIHIGAGAPPPAPAARLAAIRRLLLDDAVALEEGIAGCLVVLYGQRASRIAALRISDVSCTDAAIRLKLGADWLDVPEPVATLLRHHLRNRSNMTTAANPASPWLFPGQLADEHRSYRRLIAIVSRLGIPARASRLAAWHQLVRQAPPAVLADALGVSPDTATRRALLAGADWAAYASRRSSLATPEFDGLRFAVSSTCGVLGAQPGGVQTVWRPCGGRVGGGARRRGRDWMPAHPGMGKKDSDPAQTLGDSHDEFHASQR
jgi:hypothetical protein